MLKEPDWFIPRKEPLIEGIIPVLRGSAKDRLYRSLRNCRDAKLRTRYLIVINLSNGRSPTDIARLLRVARSTVYNVGRRFREWGEAGLVDRREGNGSRKLSEDYLAALYEVVRSSPEHYGWSRPTWTRELLVKVLHRLTGVKVHVATMSIALKLINARRGRPKPIVGCPWSKAAKTRRLRRIQRLIDELAADESAFYEDEVDIHLNPKIGLDWMVPGQQKPVLTPGQNQKRYLAGAQDVRTGELIWVEDEQKDTLLFLRLLWELTQRRPQAKVIHVILDNYGIHKTRQVELSLTTEQGQRLRLHFLPPYCPDDNPIERTWQDLHANVTRNHTRPTMSALMQRVRQYLRRCNQQKTRTSQTLAA